jgi:two-component system response regulator FixJ
MGMTICIIDDDAAVRDSLKMLLLTQYDDVKEFDSCASFLAGYAPRAGDCLILDIHLPGMNGFELMEKLRADGVRLPVILITGRPDVAMKRRAVELGAIALLNKPVAYSDLTAALERAVPAI